MIIIAYFEIIPPTRTVALAVTRNMNSWKFSCESKGPIPLPPDSTFPEALSQLNPVSNSCYTLESLKGDFIRCRGSKERCTIELRRINKGGETHYIVGRAQGSDSLTSVTMSNGGVTVHESEVFQYLDAIELFMRFYAGRELPDGLTFREVLPSQPAPEVNGHLDQPQLSPVPAQAPNQSESSRDEFRYATSTEELCSMVMKLFFPRLASFPRPSRSLADLHGEFGVAWNGLYEGLSLWLSIIAIIAWGYLFQRLEVLHSLRFDDMVYDISVKGFSWYAVALPIGLASGTSLTGVLIGYFLKSKYRGFVSYHCLRLEIDIEEAGRILFTGCVAFGIGLLGLLHNYFTVITTNELIINRFFSFTSERAQFSDIESIVTDRREHITRQDKVELIREYEIRFHDGMKWSTYGSPDTLSLEEKWEMIHFISRKSGTPIEEAKLFED